MTQYKYNLEIDQLSPVAIQPENILINLKSHQLACLKKAIDMESLGYIEYDISNNEILNGEYNVNTNIGIIGDIVGYGKTITALSIIASANLNNIYLNQIYQKNYISCNNYSYFNYSCKTNNITKLNNIIDSTLVIVPRGPVYIQWEKTIKNNTKLNYLAIDNLHFIKKYLPNPEEIDNETIINLFSKYDVVLIKNTTLSILFEYYNNGFSNINYLNRWKRVMIDEAHDIISMIPPMHYYQLWLITGSYDRLPYTIRSSNSILFNMRDAVNDIKNINLMLVKCNKNFVRNSFKIPAPDEIFYLCRLSRQFNIIKNFINDNILEKLNANDISGAIKELGGINETEDNMVELISKDLNNSILNKNMEIEYITMLNISSDIKINKLNKANAELLSLTNKLNNLKNRISELSSKSCAICMDFLNKPVILECTHSYCGLCLMNWIKNSNNCPECRNFINIDKMIAIDNNVSNNDEYVPLLSKDEILINIIHKKQNGKFLIFSKYESGFLNIINKLNDNNITWGELKGNTSHMMKVLDNFRNNKTKVILLNTQYAGSGIDISFATDVIIYHSMGKHKQQAIGRAQRVGRNDKLVIHNLCFEHEMPS